MNKFKYYLFNIKFKYITKVYKNIIIFNLINLNAI
jgi:hypothetical protein